MKAVDNLNKHVAALTALAVRVGHHHVSPMDLEAEHVALCRYYVDNGPAIREALKYFGAQL